MRPLLRYGPYVIGVCVLTVIFSRYAFAYPDHFLPVPELVWVWADRLVDGGTYEDKRAAELVVVVLVSLMEAVVVCVLLQVTVRLVLSRLKRNSSKRSVE